MPLRRSHKKSRNGCYHCKRRRVKCSEDHPCSNCSKRGVECTYKGSNHLPPHEESRRKPSEMAQGIRDCTEVYDSSAPRISAKDGFSSFHEKISQTALLSQEWTQHDPELMHHYTLYTSKSLAQRPEMQETWQVDLPKMAYSNEFLTHAILALSALHIATLKPERHSWYMTSSRFHISLGLRSFRRVLASPTAENCCALFAFSSLLLVYIYASPPESAGMEDSEFLGSMLELFKLCRGILMLGPYLSVIKASPLGPLFRHEFGMDLPNEINPPNPLLHGAQEHLHNLHHLLTTEPSSPTEKAICTQALTRLTTSFTTIQTAELPLECGMIYMFPLSVDEELFALLSKRHPFVLVLLAFHCAQLHVFRHYWFVGGRGRLLLDEIEGVLPGRLRGWIEWPRAVVCGD